ncbi:MAG TPA: amino acid adenylation domain-containing protein [Acidobacteriota bacterium]|nr:amino acid adenylation domain-containing protein [Acidobacteriota bacterium]
MSDERPSLLHQAFEIRAARTPDRIAVSFAGASLSYRQLNRHANRLAHHLRSQGVGPDDRVGILLERSADWIWAVLGILKAGAAYLPLDVAWPKARLQAVARETGMAKLVTREAWALKCGYPSDLCCRLETLEEDPGRWPARNPQTPADDRNLAYVICTSGSTGPPKGVMVEHRSVMNLLRALQEAVYGPRRQLRIGLNGPLAFDTSVKQLIQLCRGHTLHVLPEEARQDPRRLADFLADSAPDVLDCTPTQLAAWLSQGCLEAGAGWRGTLLVAGEAIQADLWSRLLGLRGCPSYNLYGPTECTVDASVCRIDGGPARPSIGKAVAATRIDLLDDSLRPVTPGAEGEICIAGAGVARGYLRRPALTAQRFLPDPSAEVPGSRLYASGDWARQGPQGELEFLGRRDEQVKLRGVRIELGEIRAAAQELPGVRQAAVLLRSGQQRQKCLVAYLVPQGTPADLDRLRRLLRERLPDYMMPSALMWIEELPLTPNGKLDREALPFPETSKRPFRPPRTPLEETLAAVWSEVLGRSEVGIDDSFFQLGGHSLLLGQAAARIRDVMGREVPLDVLFERETVSQLAGWMEQAPESAAGPLWPPVEAHPRRPHDPVSAAQEGIFFLQRLAPANVAYLALSVIRFRGPLQAAALQKALTEIVRRHEIYRTTFTSIEGRPRQVVHPPWQVELPLLDLSGDGEQAQAGFEDFLKSQGRSAVDVGKLPLVRWTLVKLGSRRHALVHLEHHLLTDGWSFTVFVRELRDLYTAFQRGQPSPLQKLPVQFADFCRWQRAWLKSGEARRQLNYWKERVAGAKPVLDLPLDRPRPGSQSFRGAMLRFRIPSDLAERLRQAARRENATLFMFMLAAFFALLRRLTGQNDISLGTGIANRRRREAESLIGMIINTLVLRLELPGDPTLRQLLRQVRRITLEAYAHQDFPFNSLVEALQPRRDLSLNPLFQAAFNFHDSPLPGLGWPPLEVEVEEVLDNGSSKFDMNLIVIPRGRRHESQGGLTVVWEYNTDLFERPTIERFFERYRRLLQALLEQPDERLSELDLVSREERRQMRRWNQTRSPYPQACVHHLAAQTARRIPDGLALESAGQSLTYAALDRCSGRLAGGLSRLGAGPGSVVAACLGRSILLPLGLLAVMKAGGAYLPLDADHPKARLRSILRDAGASLLLADSTSPPSVEDCGVPVVRVEELLEETRDGQVRRGAEAGLDDPAYLIYTSGSTGRPKGVMVTHRNLINLLASLRTLFATREGERIFALTNLTFDIAALELFLPLIVGAKCCLASRPLSAGQSVVEEMSRCDPDLVQATPSGWRALLELGWKGGESITALSGGEALPPSLARRLLERSAESWNLYGPTETTIWSTAHQLNGPQASVPIGRPLANTEIFVLDPNLRRTPMGVAGELAIGGEGVALGYLKRPALTAAAFVPDPYASSPGRRMYRTGDLVRLRLDGNLDFIGRRDHQVKVRGFRIELGEIESALTDHEEVAAAVVTAPSRGPGEDGLVAYLVGRRDLSPRRQELVAASVAEALKERLPDYMIPAIMMWLEELPLTPNGKVNRAALPAPEAARQQSFAAPRTQAESALAAIWSEVLGQDQIGIHDNFFGLGGHSFSAMQVISRVYRDLQVDLPLQTIFEQPVLADCASAIEARTGAHGRPQPEADLFF